MKKIMDEAPKVETRVVVSGRPLEVKEQPRFNLNEYSIFGGAKLRASTVQFFDTENHGMVDVVPHVKMLLDIDRNEGIEQRTPAWYEKRHKHLTASMIASAAGCNKYESRSKAVINKAYKGSNFNGNEATEHGNRYEDTAAREYERVTGHKILHFGLLESLHDDEDFLAGSPDGITTLGRLIEIKCPYYRTPDGTVPSHYMFQLQCLMNILDLEVCDFIEFLPATGWETHELWVVEVKRSRDFWAYYMPRLREFWDDVLKAREEIGEENLWDRPPEPPKKKRKSREIKQQECMVDLSYIPASPDEAEPDDFEEDELDPGIPLLSKCLVQF
nr:PDDEXK family nucleases [Sicyoidochytrium minutum DNA virus]